MRRTGWQRDWRSLLADDGLTATVAVGLTFFSDARRGCAFLAAFFLIVLVFLTFLDFLDVVTLVTGAFFFPWFCHLLSFCRHRTDLARFLRMVH
jgi:hypothetical protein